MERLGRRLGILVLLLAAAGSSISAAMAAEIEAHASSSSDALVMRPWLDSSRSADERARLVVAAMTLNEKLSLVRGDTVLDGNGSGTNACVGHLPAIERLQIPALCLGDGPAGVGNGMERVTQFPAPVAGAATWDAALLKRYGAALGAEHAGKGRNVVLAPTLNILRTPKWGRGAETLSEDPYLTARLGVALVEGIQSRGVIATPKHFAANNQETLRLGDAPGYDAIDVLVSERALREIYFPAFEAVVREAGAGSIMCSYNKLNATYACENPALYTVLREEWGFDGFVVSDWYFAHRSAVPAALAGLDVSMPGGASPFGFEDFYGAPLREALSDGRVPVRRLDEMVLNVVRPMFRLGLIGQRGSGSVDADVRSDAHRKLTFEIASQGSVLLKNAGAVLPFGERIRSIAVIGDDAGEHVQTTERYGGFVNDPGIVVSTPLAAITRRAGTAVTVSHARGTLGIGPLPPVPASVLTPASGGAGGLMARWYGTPNFSGPPLFEHLEPTVDLAALPPGLPKVWSVRWTGTLTPPRTGRYRFSLAGGGEIALYVEGREVVQTFKQGFTSVTHGIVTLAAGRPVAIRLDYSMAPTLSKPVLQWGWQTPDDLLEEAVAAARKADVAVVFVADNVSEGGDRTSLALPGDQDALIAAVADANRRTVVVLHTGGPVLMPWLSKVAGVVAAWYPGQEAGESIAAVLFGDVNPSGKLPMTFPASEDQGPGIRPESFPGVGGRVRYDEDLLVGYRYYDTKRQTPLFPFGFGLSYTRFRMDGVRVTRTTPDRWRVEGAVSNAGGRPGAEVVQLYVGFPNVAGEPPWQLKGFERIALAPGERRAFRFDLGREALSIWDAASRRWVVPPGRFQVGVGSSSRGLEQRAMFETRRGGDSVPSP